MSITSIFMYLCRVKRILFLFLFLFIFSYSTYSFIQQHATPPTLIEQIQHIGELRVAIMPSYSSYYTLHSSLMAGMEYEILQAFAKHLQVRLELVVKHNPEAMLTALHNQQVHMTTAIAITAKRQQSVNFSQPYQYRKLQLIYRSNENNIKTLQDLRYIPLEIVPNSHYQERLQQLKKTYPEIKWTMNTTATEDDILYLISEKLIDASITHSDEIKALQFFYPELRIAALDLSEKYPVAWAFPQQDKQLVALANTFLQQNKTVLQQTYQRYFDHFSHFDYVKVRLYHRHIITRLPTYLSYFKKAGNDNNIDWALIAALSYQESHWNPKATSPTGVQGLMMLTQDTAKYLGVPHRTDPFESIFGGAYYLHKLYQRFPDTLKEPQRILFTLAAYNIGYGHIRDVMKMAEKKGLNGFQWVIVKKLLPQLRNPQFHKQTRYGYARGDEAVTYVRHIMSYYAILRWYLLQQSTPSIPKYLLSIPLMP